MNIDSLQIIDRTRNPLHFLEGFKDCIILITYNNYIDLVRYYTTTNENGEFINHLVPILKERNVKLVEGNRFKYEERSKTVNEWMNELSEGNPGAFQFLYELAIIKPAQKSYSDYCNTLKRMNLKGSYLYMLWNDSCNRNTYKVIEIIDLIEKNIIKHTDIEERVLTQGRAKSFDDFFEVKDENSKRY